MKSFITTPYLLKHVHTPQYVEIVRLYQFHNLCAGSSPNAHGVIDGTVQHQAKERNLYEDRAHKDMAFELLSSDVNIIALQQTSKNTKQHFREVYRFLMLTSMLPRAHAAKNTDTRPAKMVSGLRRAFMNVWS